MEPVRRITIKDVARLADVSPAAVSQAMNNGGRMREETRTRIFQAADQLGWRPSTTARAVNGIQPHAIGLVVRRETGVLHEDAFFPGLLAGIEQVASRHQLAVTLRFVNSYRDEEDAYRTLWRDRVVSGFLVTDIMLQDRRFDLLEELGARAVAVGDLGQDERFPSCDHDLREAILDAVSALHDMGHEGMLHVPGPEEFVHSHQRRHLLQQACDQVGMNFATLPADDFTFAAGARAAAKLVGRGRLPSLVACANDAMAVGAIKAFSEHGVSVPRDVSLLGFDGLVMGEYTQPSLSTVACDFVRLGVEATTLLLGDGDLETAGRRLLPAVWRPGGSTSTPPAA